MANPHLWPSELIDFAQSQSIEVHEFAWESKMERAGFQQNALYLIRPDDYVALANSEQKVSALQDYLNEFQLSPFNAQ